MLSIFFQTLCTFLILIHAFDRLVYLSVDLEKNPGPGQFQTTMFFNFSLEFK